LYGLFSDREYLKLLKSFWRLYRLNFNQWKWRKSS